VKVYKVLKARRAIPGVIAVGDTYYWWKFRRGGKRFSKTYPKPSQLTMSEFWSTVLEWSERSRPDADGIEGYLDDLKSEVDTFKSEQEDKLSNMPDALQEGDTGQMIQGRVDALEDLHSNLDSIDTEIDDDLSDEAKEERLEEIWTEIQDNLGNVSCD
jgi:hypothetical protein